ncbi:MAG: iron-containing alcohol dehydrogenase, partial [Candidatus Bathyarchaeota archaeon]|nr:iron-containing alcohol dehydrogenase [Candidatus Bathyarchaeota archaeon]
RQMCIRDSSRVLLVTDHNLRALGVTRDVEKALSEEGLVFEVFSDVEAEPSIGVAERVAEFARNGRYDVVIGVGGGSVLDMAKIASIAPTNPGSMRSYIGVDLVKKNGLPKILMPTTAGTGSEVTRVAVITLEDEEVKSAIISPYLLSDVAIVDPKLTFSMPQKIAASTGLDALSHALEAVMAVNANPITDALALQAIRIIYENLPRSYRIGDAESRVNMSLGSLMAGMAFANSWVCLGHALAYSFSVAYKLPHGISCGLSLPYAFKYNMPAILHKIPRIAEAVGISEEKATGEKLGKLILYKLLSMLKDLNVPNSLKDIGVPESSVEKIADKLLTLTRLIRANPRNITREDALKLVAEMWRGLE